MNALYAPIGRVQRERGGLLIEATLPDATIADALERAVGASLAEMGRPEEIAGTLLSVARRGGGIVLHALVTSTRAAALATATVYKGIECQISLLGDRIAEIALVDRPLGKFSGAEPQKIAILYKRKEVEMSIMSTIHKYYGTKPVSDEDIDAAWQKMTPQERTLLEIKSALRQPVNERNFFPWLNDRAKAGGSFTR